MIMWIFWNKTKIQIHRWPIRLGNHKFDRHWIGQLQLPSACPLWYWHRKPLPRRREYQVTGIFGKYWKLDRKQINEAEHCCVDIPFKVKLLWCFNLLPGKFLGNFLNTISLLNSNSGNGWLNFVYYSTVQFCSVAYSYRLISLSCEGVLKSLCDLH